jgi:hypothetical protein
MHLLVPVSINGHSPFPFAVEPSRSRTLVSARTIETLGLTVDDSSPTLAISGKLAYPLLHLDSVAAGTAVLKCRGILGADFLRNFTVSLDFKAENLLLEG